MSQANPYAPTVETGPPGGGSVGGSVSGSATPRGAAFSGGFGGMIGNPADSHVSAAIALGAVIVLILLWQSKFRFSMAVGGR